MDFVPEPHWVLKQGDPQWKDRWLGNIDGFDTIGRKGCTLTSLAIAARVIGTSDDVTPDELQDECRAKAAFFYQRLLIHVAAPLVGLEAPLRDRRALRDGHTEEDLRRCADHAVEALSDVVHRGVAILGVDHDSRKPGGDPDEDHYLCLVRHQKKGPLPPRYLCIDPADGSVVSIDRQTLQGTTRGKTYRVVSVRPVRRRS
jgi:hypothetical protein